MVCELVSQHTYGSATCGRAIGFDQRVPIGIAAYRHEARGYGTLALKTVLATTKSRGTVSDSPVRPRKQDVEQ